MFSLTTKAFDLDESLMLMTANWFGFTSLPFGIFASTSKVLVNGLTILETNEIRADNGKELYVIQPDNNEPLETEDEDEDTPAFPKARPIQRTGTQATSSGTQAAASTVTQGPPAVKATPADIRGTPPNVPKVTSVPLKANALNADGTPMTTKQWLDLIAAKAPWEIPGPPPSIPAPKLPAPKCPITQVTHATPGVSSTDPMPQPVFQDTQVAGVKAATLEVFMSDNKYFVQFPGQTTFTELNPSAVKDFNLPPWSYRTSSCSSTSSYSSTHAGSQAGNSG
jgi:hypothetical protein